MTRASQCGQCEHLEEHILNRDDSGVVGLVLAVFTFNQVWCNVMNRESSVLAHNINICMYLSQIWLSETISLQVDGEGTKLTEVWLYDKTQVMLPLRCRWDTGNNCAYEGQTAKFGKQWDSSCMGKERKLTCCDVRAVRDSWSPFV